MIVRTHGFEASLLCGISSSPIVHAPLPELLLDAADDDDDDDPELLLELLELLDAADDDDDDDAFSQTYVATCLRTKHHLSMSPQTAATASSPVLAWTPMRST